METSVWEIINVRPQAEEKHDDQHHRASEKQKPYKQEKLR